MNDERFSRILRSALAMTLASPAIVAAASCGGSISDVPPGSSGTGAPTSTTNNPPSPTTTTTTTTTGRKPEPPPIKDASIDTTSTTKDTGVDSGGQCGSAKLPDDSVCSRNVQLPCSVNRDAGSVDQQTCMSECPHEDGGMGPAYFCGVQRDANNEPFLVCNYCVIGRRPEGLVAASRATGSVLGAFFADASHLEAASIHAFERLRDELADHDAPVDLLERAERAAADEVRHARATGSLARHYGVDDGEWSSLPRIDSLSLDVEKEKSGRVARAKRSLADIAVENAIEGQVRETFGALVGMWQAERASDERARSVMRTIARDEVRHAALAWSVAEWAKTQLDDDARGRVDRAMREAIATLASELDAEPAAELVDRAGLPSASEARSLLAAIDAALWREVTIQA